MSTIVEPVLAHEGRYSGSQWDRLLASSQSTLPTLRGECLAHFVNTFAPGRPHCVNVASVLRNGQLAAAIPLVTQFRAGIPYRLTLPVNEWMKCGDLLVDSSMADESLFDELAQAILAQRGWLIDFPWVASSGPWQQLLAAFQRLGCLVDKRHQFNVGVIELTGDWDTWFSNRSKNHRKKMRSGWRQLCQTGNVAVQRIRNVDNPQGLNELLGRIFAVEKAGWKGQRGTAVLDHPLVESLYREVAAVLNRSGTLEVYLLTVNDRPIAFDMGYLANQTWFSHKIGFDPQFARFSPGQLLLYRQLSMWFSGADVRRVDTMGILSEATAKWTSQVEPRFRYRISRPGLIDRSALRFLWRLRNLAKGTGESPQSLV